MFKGILTDVAQEAGKSSAMLLNQLAQWFKCAKGEAVYRTNQELADDLCGLLSVATINRAKHKLVETGYVIVSFEKGLNRTTHYRLTDKAKLVLGLIKAESQTEEAKPVVIETEDTPSEKPSVKPSEKPKREFQPKPKAEPKKYAQPPVATPRAMQEEFDRAGTVKKGEPMPANLLALLGKGKKAKDSTSENKTTVASTLVLNECGNDEDLFPSKPKLVTEQEISDEEYFASMDYTNMESVMSLAFNSIPNAEQRNKNLQMMNDVRGFNEEW